jgi:tetratricopeptide repeat protein 30
MAVPGTAVPGTSAGGMGLLYGASRGLAPEGQLTATIYGMIKDGKYSEATRILTIQLQNFPRSRAALSLLGYCFYQMQDFRSAAQVRTITSSLRCRLPCRDGFVRGVAGL